MSLDDVFDQFDNVFDAVSDLLVEPHKESQFSHPTSDYEGNEGASVLEGDPLLPTFGGTSSDSPGSQKVEHSVLSRIKSLSPISSGCEHQVFALLSDEEQHRLNLVPVIRDDAFDRVDEDDLSEISHRSPNQSNSIPDQCEDINCEKTILRIRLTEEEFWELRDAEWEQKEMRVDTGKSDRRSSRSDSQSSLSSSVSSHISFSSPPLLEKSRDSSTIVAGGKEKQVTELTPKEWAQAVKVSEEILGYDSFQLPIVYEYRRTGFEATKELILKPKMLIAGRYEFNEQINEAAFSITLRCNDIKEEREVCVKVIKNNKDFFDQSLDEIKLLEYLNKMGDADDNRFIRLYDYFYHKEHLFIVTELLQYDLYLAYTEKIHKTKVNGSVNTGDHGYFTIEKLKVIAKQCLLALKFVHGLGLIHCDLKPENIMMEEYETGKVKLIDFGSSCFATDDLSTYIQSRFYRAPEVILGMKYDQKIDIWSLGCVLAELYIGRALFDGDTAASMLAKMVHLVGPFPKSMILKSDPKQLESVLIQQMTLYERCPGGDGFVELLYPYRGSLEKLIRPVSDAAFLELLQLMLNLDPDSRPSADLCLQHAWFTMSVE